MSTNRTYEVNSGLISISATTATPALYIATGANNDCNLVKFKVSVEAVSSPAPPSNGSIYFSLNKVTGAVGGGAAVTPVQLSGNTLAAQTTFKSGSTALTGLTQGAELWPGPIPYTAGAAWSDDFENTGLEAGMAASATWCVYFQAASGAGSGCSARVVLWFAE